MFCGDGVQTATARGHSEIGISKVCQWIHLNTSAERLEKLQGSRPGTFKYYQDLLDIKGLEAVFIATPPQWHALHFLAACEKGLDIYAEKPLSYDVMEGMAMVNVWKKTGNIVQVGFQRRQNNAFKKAKEIIESGRIGEVHQIVAQIHYNPEIRDTTIQPPPASLDWEEWCGPAPKLDYCPNIAHFAWRLEKEYGNGHLVDWGIHYIDISASYHILSRIETLHEEAEEAGATAVLSVGLVPGLTNLLVKHSQSRLPDMTFADIYLMFGLGEVHGEAAYQWISENLNTEFTVLDHGETKRVKSFEDGRQTKFPGESGKRTVYAYNFPEQHVLLQTLGLGRVSTWLCFDSAFATRLFALFKRTGLSRVTTIKRVEKTIISILKPLHLVLKRLHLGSEEIVIKVEAGNSPEKGVLYECSLSGESEARVTGLVTAKVAEKIVLSPFPSGVFHIEQLLAPLEFLESLSDHGLEFEEKEFVTPLN